MNSEIYPTYSFTMLKTLYMSFLVCFIIMTGKNLNLSSSFPPFHAMHAAFISHGVTSILQIHQIGITFKVCKNI